MADSRNFLLGYGERLVDSAVWPSRGKPTPPPYSFQQAVDRLAPMTGAAATELAKVPAKACPNDMAVAVVTLHPQHISKSAFPHNFIHETGGVTLGSRPSTVKPERWTRKDPVAETTTTDLFVAWRRKDIARLKVTLEQAQETVVKWVDDVRTLEKVRASRPEDRLRVKKTPRDEILLEVGIHSPVDRRYAFVVDTFIDFAESLGGKPDKDRRVYTGGLCFMPLRISAAKLQALAAFQFLRVARPMPAMRVLEPKTVLVPSAKTLQLMLPSGGPIDKSFRVAIFDGGLPDNHGLDRWVTCHDTSGCGDPHHESTIHGLQTTSALLFGPLKVGEPIPVPFAAVDHYRVTDVSTGNSLDLYDILPRLQEVLSRKQHAFCSLSVGPIMEIEDTDVHPWTSVIDEALADGTTFLAVAAGNTGELQYGFDRVQVPGDSVNALVVGAADSDTQAWARASYSSIGPGRSPGLVKPDVVAFGGCQATPFYVLGKSQGIAEGVTGTSFSTPSTMRMGMGLRAHFGERLSPLAIRCLLIHCADPIPHPQKEVGWGRIPLDLDEIVICPPGMVRVVYQGTIQARNYRRAVIPVPAAVTRGKVEITATFCYACEVDPQDPSNYTRSSLDVYFRPHKDRFEEGRPDPTTDSFFRQKDYQTEAELRANAHKWETVKHAKVTKLASSLSRPVFDIHHNAREGGDDISVISEIRYALVVTVRATQRPEIYNDVLDAFAGRLETIVPVVSLPIRTRTN